MHGIANFVQAGFWFAVFVGVRMAKLERIAETIATNAAEPEDVDRK